jgi:hypothetical protein
LGELRSGHKPELRPLSSETRGVRNHLNRTLLAMNRASFLKVALAFALSVNASQAAPPKKTAKPSVRSTGIFSDLEISRETGDVGGLTMFFFLADKSYVLLIRGEGELRKPELCEVAEKGGLIRFKMMGAQGPLEFTGSFTGTHVSGKFSDGSSLKLPRKKAPLMTTFSNLAFSKESGDAMGQEIVSLLADQSYVLILEGAGDLLPPVVTPAQKEDRRLSFRVRRPNGSVAVFNGVESKTSLTGAFLEADGTKQNIALPAKKSFWE